MSKKYLVYDAEKQEFREIHEEDYETVYNLLRDNVNGMIDNAGGYFPFEGIDVWVNDEGLLHDLPFACVIEFKQGSRTEKVPLAGNIVFARFDDETGDTLPLTDDDMVRIEMYFKSASTYLIDMKHGLMVPVFEREV